MDVSKQRKSQLKNGAQQDQWDQATCEISETASYKLLEVYKKFANI